jgi:nicotinamidase-related amidase
MSDLKTLREVAGLGHQPGALRQSALVMIDCQNTYRRGLMQLEGVEPALDEARRLLERVRALGVPVIHIQHDSGPGSPYDIRAEIGRIADKVKPLESEPVVVKHYPNSFVQTDLHERLQKLGVSNLVIAGFMTHMCVSSTARAALDLGYKAVVAADAAATRDLPDPMGGVIGADALHRAALAELADRFAIVAKVDQIPGK